MTDRNWSISSSSEDDEDAHYFQSNIREDSEYFRKFLRKDYGTDDWADHIPQFRNLGLNNNNDQNRPSFTNVSMSNGTVMNILQLPCSVPDRVMVLNRDTNQYEVMRYIEMVNGVVITPEPEANLLDPTVNGTMANTSTSTHFQNNSFIPHINGGTKHIPKHTDPTPIIPSEPVDLVDLIGKNVDRRKPKPTPDFLMELPMPQFYHELEWNGKDWIIPMEPKEPKPNRIDGFKKSMSFIRERSDRINLHQQKNDPRFNKDLFPSPSRVPAHTFTDKAKKTIFGTDSDSSIPVSHSRSRSPSMSPAFSAFNSGSDFAAERNSTALPCNYSDSDSTASDISLSDSDTFEENAKRKARSHSRKKKKSQDKLGDKENEKVPRLIIKLKKQPNKKEEISVPSKLFAIPPAEMNILKNDVLAAINDFADDEHLTNKGSAEKCDEILPTQFPERINQTDNAANNVTECMDMDVDGDAVAGTSADANQQPKKTETEAKDINHELDEISDNEMMVEQPKTKDDSHGLDEISDNEIVDEQPGMASHGNLTDLEDVSMEESDEDKNNSADLDHLFVDDKILDEAVKEVLGVDGNAEDRANTNSTSEIEKSLALFDEVGSDEIERFVEAKSNEEIVVTPKPVNSIDRNELIKILDPGSSAEKDVSTESGPGSENVPPEQEVDNFDVPEIGATADVGLSVDNQSDQINLGDTNDLNSFGRPRNLLPDSVDETYRLKITIGLLEYNIAENELEKLLREDDNDEEHGDLVGESMHEQCDDVKKALETPVTDMHNDNEKMQNDFNVIETSEDDQEYDAPIDATENNVVPNSNTDRRATQKNLKCTMCPYVDLDGWKKLTKHYIRKHPDAEIAHSRLAERFKLNEIVTNPVTSTVTDQMLIKSICLFCDQYYCLNSSKWEKHFVSHTGECPFECRKCGSKLFDDVHKRCQSMNNIIINGPHEFTQNKLYGYVCKLCNFVQLTKQNISKHIDQQHQAMPNEESIIEIYLINAPETVPKPCKDYPTEVIEIEIESDEEQEMKISTSRLVTPEKSANMSSPIDLTMSDEDEVD